jgi:hypothetical protein
MDKTFAEQMAAAHRLSTTSLNKAIAMAYDGLAQRLSTVEPQPTPTPTPTPTPEPEPVPTPDLLSVAISPTNTAGWSLEVSDSRNVISVLSDRIRSSVGGFTAVTHYARARRKLPEVDNIAPRGRFIVTSTFELPADFYTNAQSYMRFVTLDNYPGTMKSTGTRVGAVTEDEWRVGFLIYGNDFLPRFISEHENHAASKLELWTGATRLPVGRNTVEIDFTPSKTAGALILKVNGATVLSKTGVPTVPSTITDAEAVVTRVGGGIDGASAQSTKRVTVDLHSLTFIAK